MKTFAVLDTNETGLLVRLGHQELLPALFGEVFMTRKVQEELSRWKGVNADAVREFAKSPPSWVVLRDPKEIHPEVAAAERAGKLDPGEVSSISLGKELSKDGSPGVILSDDGEVRKFLNREQDPEKARNADRWATFGIEGRTLPAPDPQTIFAANTYSTICRANEKGLIQEFDKEVERINAVLEPSDRAERLLNQYQSSNREQQEKIQEQQKQQQERQRRSRDRGHSH